MTLITVAEAQIRTGWTQRYICFLLGSGKITGVKSVMGSRLHWTAVELESLEAFLAPPPEPELPDGYVSIAEAMATLGKTELQIRDKLSGRPDIGIKDERGKYIGMKREALAASLPRPGAPRRCIDCGCLLSAEEPGPTCGWCATGRRISCFPPPVPCQAGVWHGRLRE